MKKLSKNLVIFKISAILFIFYYCSENFKNKLDDSFNRLSHNIDSLKVLYKNTKIDTLKLKILEKIAELEKDNEVKIKYNDSIIKICSLLYNRIEVKVIIKYKANSFLRNGLVFYGTGNFNEAEKCFIKCISLYKEINDKKNVSNALHIIGNIYLVQDNHKKALDFYSKSLKIREEINNKQGMSDSYNNMGIVYKKMGKYDTAIYYYDKSLRLLEELADTQSIAYTLGNIGNIYLVQGNYTKALEYYNKCLTLLQAINDKYSMAASYINIGTIYLYQGDYSKSIEYFNKSLKLDEEIDNKEGISISLNNLALIYSNLGDYTKALEYYYKSLKYSKEIGDKQSISNVYTNIGTIYFKNRNFIEALEYYKKSLKISEEIDDVYSMVSSLGNMATIYLNSGDYDKALEYYNIALNLSIKNGLKGLISPLYNGIGEIYKSKGNYNIALQYALKANMLAKETGNINDISSSARLLKDIYYKIGDYKLSIRYYDEFILSRDSIQNETSKKLAQQKYYQHQYEKKAAADSVSHAKAIEIKNIEIEKQKSEAKKNKIIAAISIVGILILFAFLLFVYNTLRITRKQKSIIETQKKVVDEKNVLLNKQNIEISNQKDIIVKQKEEIEQIHNKLKSSINYAKRIQEAVLPSREAGKSIKRPHFIFFKPKDIVSGDFYWYTEIDCKEVYAVADCTGHGVPGAFMSMLSIALLNEIVRKKEVTQANHVLNELRKEIITALKQRGEQNEQKDGMDISLFTIDKDKGVCQWAGANNPLYIVMKQEKLSVIKSNENIDTENKTIIFTPVISSEINYHLFEIPPDNMPVSIHIEMKEFSNNVFILPECSTIYLFSDGFADQFGGEKNKKYGYPRFKKLLLSLAYKEIYEQVEIIENEFVNWKGNNEQIDDISIMGIKF